VSAALEIVKNNPFIIIIIIIIKNLKIWKSSIESPRNILVSSVVSPVLFSKNHADSLISDHCTRWRTIFAFSIANSYARKRHECTSDYWDLAFPQMKFHKTARGPWPPVVKPKDDVYFPHRRFSALTTEFFLSLLGCYTLPSHVSAEACLTGWPNAQPQGRD